MRMFFYDMCACKLNKAYKNDQNNDGDPGYIQLVAVMAVHDGVVSKILVNKDESFEDWDTWKAKQKQGVDCSIKIYKEGNKITVLTENEGVHLKNVTRIDVEVPKIYAALSGDQCALTGITVKKG